MMGMKMITSTSMLAGGKKKLLQDHQKEKIYIYKNELAIVLIVMVTD